MSGGRVHDPGVGAALLRLLLGIALVLGVVTLAAGWYFADQLTARPTVRPFGPEVTDTRVVAADESSITLTTNDDLHTGGRFGLQLPNDGYARLADATDVGPDEVTYAVESYAARVPSPGTAARVDEYWRTGTPAVVGVDHRDVEVDGQLGPMASWWVPSGDAGTVVYVHGRGATREEALRFLPDIADAGWSTLVTTYRGDEGAPPLRDGRLRYGVEEWVDVEAAIDWVRAEVDRDGPIVLFGSSMGGAVVAQLLDRSQRAGEVDAVVLDSPMVSLDTTLDRQAELAGVPGVLQPALVPVAEVIAGLLYGLEPASLEQTDDDGTFTVPTLVFHGAADAFVPWTQTLRLSQRNPNVDHVAIEGAGHVRSWNVDAERYRRELGELLDRAAA